jgi:hypothetical protein
MSRIIEIKRKAMGFFKKPVELIAVILCLHLLGCTQTQKDVSYFDTQPNIDYQKLKEGFNNVPQEARMRTWWFWMSGNATKKSISQDLEAMKDNGIAGAILIDNGGDYAPIGPAFMSDEWKALFAHVIKEADRLGIEISMNIQSGAGDSGNPKIEKDGKSMTEGNAPFTNGASKVFVRDKELEVLEGGEYYLKLENGNEINIKASPTNNVVNIAGPWQITFQEKPTLGEPFSATFEDLISWTESNQHKIKYFSGTALYENSFHIENNDMSKNRAYLNLGKVGDIATVKLNGEEVGIYWKAPYIPDITDYLKEGENILEVSVTNLWVNRLIGDEKLLPEERKTKTNLRNSKGRYSFERFARPDADKYLRYSGLMGPVKVQFSRIYDIKYNKT